MRTEDSFPQQADELQCHRLGVRSVPYLIPFDEYLSSLQEISVISRYVDESVDLHWHDFMELEYVSTGNGVHHFNRQIVPFSAGSLHLLLPTDFHSVEVDRGDQPFVYSLKFSETLLDGDVFNALFRSNTGKQLFVPPEQRAHIEQTFQRLAWEYNNRAIFREKVMKDLLQMILITLERLAHDQQNEQYDQQTLSSNTVVCTMTYMRENFSQPLTLETVADNVHLSPNYLSMLFRKTTGFTISEYLRKTRMRNAMVYLLNPDKTVLQVSEKVGYNSYEHFERVFRKEFNVSPKEFRRLVLEHRHNG